MKSHLSLALYLCLSISAIAQGPTRVEVLEIQTEEKLIAAQTDFLLQNYDKAIEGYDAVLELDAQNDVAMYEKARCYAALDRVDDADKFFDRAITMNPSNAWYYLTYAKYKEDALQFPAASEIYRRLSQQFPAEPDYHISLAFSELKAGNLKQAAQALEDHKKLLGPTEENTLRLFDIYKRTKDYDKTEEVMQDYLSAFPDNTTILLQYANHKASRNQDAEAKKLYGRILQIDPEHSQASIQYAAIGRESQPEDEQITVLKTALANSTVELDDKIKQLIPFVEKFVQEDKAELGPALLEATEILVQTHPYDAKSYAIAGDVTAQLGEVDQAISYYEQTIELRNTNYQVWEQLFYLYHETYNFKAITDKSDQALSLFPNKAQLYYLSARAFAQMNDHEEALYLVDENIYMTGRTPAAQYRALLLKAEILSKKDPKSAEQLALKAIEINSDAPAAHRVLALSQITSDAKKALEILKAHPEPSSAEYYHILALTQAQMNSGTQAEAHFQKALELQDSPLIHMAYGDYLAESGQSDQSQIQWTRAAELLPYKDPKLQEKIKQAQNP